MRIVCGLDVLKDSVFVYIMNENGDKIEFRYVFLTPELEERDESESSDCTQDAHGRLARVE